MHMIGLKRVAPLAAILLSSLAAAQSGTTTTYVFAQVTGIQYGPTNSANTYSVTGVLVNDSASTTVAIPIPSTTSPSCGDFPSMMISHPGVYTLTIVMAQFTAPPPASGTYTALSTCRLDRNS
jgi:hypothetical protein